MVAGIAQLDRAHPHVQLLLPDIQQFQPKVVGHVEEKADADSNGNSLFIYDIVILTSFLSANSSSWRCTTRSDSSTNAPIRSRPC